MSKQHYETFDAVPPPTQVAANWRYRNDRCLFAGNTRESSIPFGSTSEVLHSAVSGWDTHRNHFPLVKDSLVPRADQALAALLDDLCARGLLDETLVVWMGDFGRTPRITAPWASRDHWPHAFSVLMAGAGIRRGAVYGATDQQAAFVTENPVTPADLTATIFATLGIDPGTTVSNRDGQPHRLSNGRPVRELFD